jgi:hypothetical protein
VCLLRPAEPGQQDIDNARSTVTQLLQTALRSMSGDGGGGGGDGDDGDGGDSSQRMPVIGQSTICVGCYHVTAEVVAPLAAGGAAAAPAPAVLAGGSATPVRAAQRVPWLLPRAALQQLQLLGRLQAGFTAAVLPLQHLQLGVRQVLPAAGGAPHTGTAQRGMVGFGAAAAAAAPPSVWGACTGSGGCALLPPVTAQACSTAPIAVTLLLPGALVRQLLAGGIGSMRVVVAAQPSAHVLLDAAYALPAAPVSGAAGGGQHQLFAQQLAVPPPACLASSAAPQALSVVVVAGNGSGAAAGAAAHAAPPDAASGRTITSGCGPMGFLPGTVLCHLPLLLLPPGAAAELQTAHLAAGGAGAGAGAGAPPPLDVTAATGATGTATQQQAASVAGYQQLLPVLQDWALLLHLLQALAPVAVGASSGGGGGGASAAGECAAARQLEWQRVHMLGLLLQSLAAVFTSSSLINCLLALTACAACGSSRAGSSRSRSGGSSQRSVHGPLRPAAAGGDSSGSGSGGSAGRQRGAPLGAPATLQGLLAPDAAAAVSAATPATPPPAVVAG